MFGLGFLDAIGAIAKKIVQGIVDVSVFLFTHPKVLITVAVLFVGLGVYVYVAHHINNLEEEINQLERQRQVWVKTKAVYESNTRLMLQVFTENQAVLRSLEVTSALANKAKSDLEKANAASKQKINKLEEYIRSAPASDDGVVAPVLKNTIREIDKGRLDRNNVWRAQK
jgi:hypothetical protein